MEVYVLDGSMEGLLTAVFEFYERKPKAIQLVAQRHFQPVLLQEVCEIVSDESKSKCVWQGLKKKMGVEWQLRFYKAYLSEDAATFQQLFHFACYIFDNPKGAEQNFGHPAVLAVTQMEPRVNREKHRMKPLCDLKKPLMVFSMRQLIPILMCCPLLPTSSKSGMRTNDGLSATLKENTDCIMI
jgi:probable DNA metabolism protein